MSHAIPHICFGEHDAQDIEQQLAQYDHPAIHIERSSDDYVKIGVTISNRSNADSRPLTVAVHATGEVLSKDDHRLNDTIIAGLIQYSPPIATFHNVVIRANSTWAPPDAIPWQISQNYGGKCIALVRITDSDPRVAFLPHPDVRVFSDRSLAIKQFEISIPQG